MACSTLSDAAYEIATCAGILNHRCGALDWMRDARAAQLTERPPTRTGVKHVLSTQPVYKYPDVQVITSQGVVELKGSVSNDSQKELASEIVRSVRGVNQLENNISVVALDRERVREASP